MKTALSGKGSELTQAESLMDRIYVTGGDFLGLLALLRYARDEKVRIALSIGAIGIGAIVVMVAARLLGDLVSVLSTAGTSNEASIKVASLAAAILSMEILAIGAQFLGRLGLAKSTTVIACKVREDLFTKMNHLPMSYFDTQPMGRTITRLTNDVEGIEGFFSGTLARLLTALIQVIAVLVAMIATDTSFGTLVVAASLPAVLFTFMLRKQVRHWLRLFKQRSAYLNARLAEFVNGMAVIKAFGLEEWTQNKFREAAEFHYRSGISLMNWNSIIRPMTVLLSTIPMVVVLAVGGSRVLDGALELGILVVFLRYAERFGSPVRSITQEIQTIQEALTSSERLRQMMAEPEESQVLGPDGDYSQQIVGKVEFRDVWLRYRPEPTPPVLRGISFVVEPGKKIGIVGATGSGKTSTISLLAGLYPIESGEILVDDIAMSQWSRRGLRQQLGFVSQEVVIFRGTLRENLLGATQDKNSVAPEVIMDACRRSGLAHVMSRFADGLNTQIIDGGENLSMGERQLVAFTRMLIKNPRILVLDEATANIDEECEQLIQEATSALLQGRTCFIIAHRLSTILACDRILVFNRGEIVEAGSHHELMASGGHYATLVKRQLTNLDPQETN